MKFTKDEIRSSMLLYAVTDRMWLKEGESLVDVAEKVLQNGATFLQIREKDLDEESFEEESEKLKALCNAYHVPFVVNDSVEIALQCGADGVHVGQSDIKGRDIRAIIGPDKILGISAGTVEQAVASFFGGHLLGKPVLAAELITLAFQQEGVANVRLVSPAADVAAAVGTLPVLGSLSVTELEA